MSESLYKRGVRILEATIAISANRRSLLPSLPPALEVKSLLTDFRAVEEVPFFCRADGAIELLEDSSAEPRYRRVGMKSFFEGPLVELGRSASDLRYSLWGNQGFLYRFALFLLEKKHGIFNLHACALYQSSAHRLFIVAGGSGSGKTVYLLSGLEQGLALFSTETVHFRSEGNRFCWFMGSLIDNVRLTTLKRHFPRFLPLARQDKTEKEGQDKRAIDLSPYRLRQEALIDPEVVLLFPRIEEDFRSFRLSPHLDLSRVTRLLFANISEKVAETVILYDHIPILGFDRRDLAEARLRAARTLAEQQKTVFSGEVISNPEQCWGDLLERRSI
ncbi:MAG: hypothetical protein AB1715_03085 [Acidobacteriota bacterium]